MTGHADPPAGDPGPLPVVSRGERIHVGDHFSVSLQRTLRLPDDGSEYPLPPGLGSFPVRPVAELGERVPAAWRETGGFVVPVYRREAVWLHFTATPWRPAAVMVGVGRVNAVTGGSWEDELRSDPQSYLVCPDQPWLDGVNSGDGTVRQFVAVELGAGDTVEEQLTGAARFGGIQVRVFEPRPGRFTDRPPAGDYYGLESMIPQDVGGSSGPGMGVAAGGMTRQRIYPDPYGLDTWDRNEYGTAHIHLVDSTRYQSLTGSAPPPSPISAATYRELGLPWFSLYDDERGDLAASERLGGVRSLRERDEQRGDAPDDADRPVTIDAELVIELPNRPDHTDTSEREERGDG